MLKEKVQQDAAEFNVEKWRSSHQVIVNVLFAGTPLSREQREQVRKPTTPNEQLAFYWRVLCDAAFQDDNQDHFPISPLSKLNFDFRSNSLEKWTIATDVLFFILSGLQVDHKEKSLILGAINDLAYADKSQFSRIQSVKKFQCFESCIKAPGMQPCWPKINAASMLYARTKLRRIRP
jgi:hypothetical protein